MAEPVLETLPLALKSVATQPRFAMKLDVKPIVPVGQTPAPFRRVGIVPAGTFTAVEPHQQNGERVRGTHAA
jgi:hypothetical protein